MNVFESITISNIKSTIGKEISRLESIPKYDNSEKYSKYFVGKQMYMDNHLGITVAMEFPMQPAPKVTPGLKMKSISGT